jgi:hypothetical protein
MLEDLANSRYLMNAYATGSDSWESFRQTGHQTSLYEVAAILCGAWTTLSEDDDFFDAMSEVSADRLDPDVRDAFRGKHAPAKDPDRSRLLSDVAAYRHPDKLLAQELVVLVQAARMQPPHAVRLVSDLRDLLAPSIEPVSGEMMSALRADVPRLADELCRAQQRLKVFNYDPATETVEGAAPHRGWVRSLRVVGKTLQATAGAAAAVGNVVGAVASFGLASGLALGSVAGGAAAMSTAVADLLEPEPVDSKPAVRRSARAVAATQ